MFPSSIPLQSNKIIFTNKWTKCKYNWLVIFQMKKNSFFPRISTRTSIKSIAKHVNVDTRIAWQPKTTCELQMLLTNSTEKTNRKRRYQSVIANCESRFISRSTRPIRGSKKAIKLRPIDDIILLKQRERLQLSGAIERLKTELEREERERERNAKARSRVVR